MLAKVNPENTVERLMGCLAIFVIILTCYELILYLQLINLYGSQVQLNKFMKNFKQYQCIDCNVIVSRVYW